MKKIYTFLFPVLIFCILTHSKLSLAYALLGLQLWFEKMIPALLPFMILSGIMIRMKLTLGFSKILYPMLRPVYKVSHNGCYAMFMGFLCGFPMGAKTIADLVRRNMLSIREAEYLLAFCNNIGPVYFCSFVLPLLNRQLILPYVFGMYGIPLFYGWLLRLWIVPFPPNESLSIESSQKIPSVIPNLLYETDDAINASVQSILSLGGYMILFNLLNLIPHILIDTTPLLLAPVLEITGGLQLSEGKNPLYLLILLSFGGLSCMAQTYSCIQGTTLSIGKYLVHKVVLTLFTALFYLMWFLLSPSTFLC